MVGACVLMIALARRLLPEYGEGKRASEACCAVSGSAVHAEVGRGAVL